MTTLSLYPLDNIDTLHYHIGFYLMTGMLVCLWLMITTLESEFPPTSFTVFCLLVILITGLDSYYAGRVVVYKNTPVVAHLVTSSEQFYTYQERVGKTTVTRTAEEADLLFETVDGSYVIFSWPQHKVIPNPITLYRN